MRTPTRTRRRWLTPILLGLVLAVATVTVPDSTVKPADMMLVEVERATTVDLNPDVLWILAVGSDARPGEEMTRTRGDALQLVGINTKTGAATAIGIPRDSYVPIPGVGSDRVNAAMYYGGPQLLGETVGNLIGIQPEYVFVTGFKTFQRMVNSIGGVYVHNPVAFSDPYLKDAGLQAGQDPPRRLHVPGVRADPQEPPGRGLRPLGQPAADPARHPRQDPREGRHPRLPGARGDERDGQHGDQRVPGRALPDRARPHARCEARKFTTCVVQGAIGNVGGASVVLPYTDQARRYGDDARDDATISRC